MHASKQICRCYPFPDPKEKKGRGNGSILVLNGFKADSAIAVEIDRVGAPWAGPMLILDGETLMGAHEGQGLRFGCFQQRGYRYDWRVADAAIGALTREKLDQLWHEGIFYEPKNCTDDEIELLEYYADTYEIDLYTRDEFIKKVLYRNHWIKYASKWEECLREPCYVIGHNLPFDLGALAIHTGLAIKGLYGGLSLVMAGGEHAETEEEFAARVEAAIKEGKPAPKKRGGFEHRIAIKKLGFGKHLYQASKQQNGAFINPETGETFPRFMEMIHCLDTQTTGRSLLGPGPSGMKDLLRRLNVSKEFRKETVDYHGPITPEYISYCRDDVENTWQIFKAERELYKRHNLFTPIHKLYSEASTGKAYLKEFKIKGFNELNPHFDKTVLSCFMEGYYGGQSDVRIRHKIVEVIHCDFKSQYPSVNILMSLQELLIAAQIGVRRDDPAARRFLETVGLDDLQRKETWKKLRGVALIVPDGDILPFRTQYGEKEDGSLNVNIGVNRVLSACPAWYTFADIIKSKLLTGKTPKILKTIELFPIGRQDTKPIKLFGDERYAVDLAKGDDLFRTLIDARIDVETERDDELTPEDRKAFLESFQNGLKIAANGTSYGVPNEFIVDDHLEEVPTTVYFGGTSTRVKARLHTVGKDGDKEISDYKAEKAGRYYAPFGVLIPAAGRLLLGIAERLAADRGLTYAFCDTDSMAFADYYNRYTREEFRTKVKEITDWFQPLNPYKHDVRLFGFEKVNFKLKDHVSGKIVKGKFEPLYCLAVSSKRYCLFNLVDIDGEVRIVIRKASAHGLGDVMLPSRRSRTSADDDEEFVSDAVSKELDRLMGVEFPDDEFDDEPENDHPELQTYKARFEHLAAPIKTEAELKDSPNDVNTRKHGKLVSGSAAPLFLDMWYAAIKELREKGTLDGEEVLSEDPASGADGPRSRETTRRGIDKVIGAWPELNAPQHSQTSLSTRDAWLHYQNLPNRRAFQFFETLPAPMMSGSYTPPENHGSMNEVELTSLPLNTEMQNAQTSSLYMPFTKPFELDLDNLYIRETNELIRPYLDVGLRLTTVADRICGYFAHGEAKSEGSVGLLKMKCVVGLSKVWIGKESHPLAVVEDLPDDETLEHYKTSGEIVEGGLNHDLIAWVGVSEIAEAARVDEAVLVDAVMGQKAVRRDASVRELGPDALARIASSIVVRPDGAIDVVKVPKSRKETAIERVDRLLAKGKRLRELAKVIYAAKGEQKHWQILRDLDNIAALVPPEWLTLAEIETYAKAFYGFSERLDRKLAKDQALIAMRERTALGARARWEKSRSNKRKREIGRIAETWNLPELKQLKDVKNARLMEKDLHKIAEMGFKPIRCVSTYRLSTAKKTKDEAGG